MDLEGPYSATSCVKVSHYSMMTSFSLHHHDIILITSSLFIQEVHLNFSESIPADTACLVQPPFVMDTWRKGPNPGEVECVVYYKVHVLRMYCSYMYVWFSSASITSSLHHTTRTE